MTAIFLMATQKLLVQSKFVFCVHNVVLDTIMLVFFSFSRYNFFFKNAENSYFFCMVCLCMP